MSEIEKNKLAAQIIKAEMMGRIDTVAKLKADYDKLIKSKDNVDGNSQASLIRHSQPSSSKNSAYQKGPTNQVCFKRSHNDLSDGRVKKFISSTSSLSQMFVDERKLSAPDEVKMFMKTAVKFSKDDMNTKYFSEEIDDSQSILNKPKRRRQGPQFEPSQLNAIRNEIKLNQEICDRCLERQAKHLIIKELEFVYLTLIDAKPFLSSMSNITIRNKDHTCDSLVSASDDHQNEVQTLIENLRVAWKSKGYSCLIMETYFKTRRPASREITSCKNHFQVHCLPIKEKHFEKSRMCFKQALQDSEGEWSLNRKLIQTNGRKIQRYLPKGLSYFWVCFGDLSDGFAHVIESEQQFSRFFGLEVLSSLLDKDFNPMKLNQSEEFKSQFERSRDFKLLYSEFDIQEAQSSWHSTIK